MNSLLASVVLVAQAVNATATTPLTGTWSYGSVETGGGDLRCIEKNGLVRFQLNCNRGAPGYNQGFIEGEFKVLNGIGIYKTDEFGPCSLTFEFKGNTVKVTQSGKDSDCGFGANVYANGVYTRISRKIPKFERPGL